MNIANVELRHLRAFVAVAEELHFTRAADRLHLTQQVLSSQIRHLEQQLDVALFARTTRKVALTEAGTVLLANAIPILHSFEFALEQTRRAGSGHIGDLSIAYTPTVAAEVLPALTAEVHERLPGINLRTTEMWQPESLEAVRFGRYDVCFVRSDDAGDELESAVIRHEALGVVLGGAHPLARQHTVQIDQLSDNVMRIWPRVSSPGYYDLVTQTFRSAGYSGEIMEYENHTRDVHFGDAVSRMELAACRAFSIAFETQALNTGFVWRKLHPEPLIPLTMCWKSPPSRPTQLFLDMAREVSARSGWQRQVA